MKKQFKVNEYGSGFEIENLETGSSHWLSDGVDLLFSKTGKSLSPGSKGFRKKLEDAYNSDISNTLEAYFPDEY